MNRQGIDIQLIKQAKNGDEKAFSALFTYYHRWIFNFIKSIVKNSTDAEDLTMLTFEKAFGAIKKYIPMVETQTWLFTIAKNTSIDFLRYKKHIPNSSVDIKEVQYLKAHIENPEEVLINKQTSKQFEVALDKIPITYRQVFEMYNDGILCRDIAKELNVSVNIVTGRIRYARKWLTNLLIKNLAS